MFPTKNAEQFLNAANTAGTINSQASLATALKMPEGSIDLFELRLDAFSETPEVLLKAIPRLKAPLLITARHFKEGGQVPLTPARRAALYKAFIPHAALMDVELRSLQGLKAVVDEARASGVIIIASFHDFKATPRPERLVQMARNAAKSGVVDIFKVAALTQTPADVARLLSLFSATKLPLSLMGMGRFGMVSRLLFAQAGSVINYGFLDAQAKVSGQWPAKVLKQRIAELAPL